MNALVASTSYALCPASGTRASQRQFVAVTKPCSQPCGPARRLPVLVAAQSSAPQPYGNGPGSFASQEQLYRQTAVQSVWTSRLGAALGLAAELLRKAASFVYSCKDVLPNFTVLSPQQALRRMILILAASLLMVVLLTTIDSGLLYAYVRTARRVLC